MTIASKRSLFSKLSENKSWFETKQETIAKYKRKTNVKKIIIME